MLTDPGRERGWLFLPAFPFARDEWGGGRQSKKTHSHHGGCCVSLPLTLAQLLDAETILGHPYVFLPRPVSPKRQPKAMRSRTAGAIHIGVGNKTERV